MRRSNNYHWHGCTRCFALRIAVGTNPFGTLEGNVDDYYWQLQGQPHDVTRAASLRGGDFNVRLQRKELRDTRVA